MISCGTTSKITSKKSSPKRSASSRNARKRRFSMAPPLLLAAIVQPTHWTRPLSRAPCGVAQFRGHPNSLFPHQKRLQRSIHILFLLDGHRDKSLMRDRAQLFVQRTPRRVIRVGPTVEACLIMISDLAVADHGGVIEQLGDQRLTARVIFVPIVAIGEVKDIVVPARLR